MARIKNLSGAQQMLVPSPWMVFLSSALPQIRNALSHFGYDVPRCFCYRFGRICRPTDLFSVHVINARLSGGVNTCPKPVYFKKIE